MAGERGFQLDMFGVPDEGATVDAAPPMLAAGGWQMAETAAFAAALKRGALGEALGVLNRVKVDVAWKVLLEAGFTVGSSASRAEMMAPVQKDIIEAAQRGMTGRELREAREKAAVEAPTARVFYRSVSPLEWEQIQKDGEIKGGLNTFNVHDQRREVFFGDKLTPSLIAQGEDRTRQAEYLLMGSPIDVEYRLVREQQKQVEAKITTRLLAMGYADVESAPQVAFLTDPALKRLQADNRKLEGELDRIREDYREAAQQKIVELRAADVARGYSSVILETRPLVGGRRYAADQGVSMMPDDEYGFDSGAVKLADIAQVRYVMDRQVIERPVRQVGEVPGAQEGYGQVEFSVERDDDDEGTLVLARDTGRVDQMGKALVVGHLHVPDEAVRSETFRIGDVDVQAAYQRRGIATAMLRQMAGHLKAVPVGATTVFSQDGQAFFEAVNGTIAAEISGKANQQALGAVEKQGGAKSSTEDAGAELTYNKRNRIKTGIRWGDIEGMEPALRVRETVKAKVFPKPDYEALIAAGMQPVHAHVVKQIYDSLAAKPATRAPTDEQLRHYIEGVNRVMSGALAWAASPSGAGAWDGRTMTSKPLLDAVYPNGWKEYREEVSLLGGNRFYGAMQPGSTELRRANKAIGEGWPASREAWEKQGFSVVFADEVKRGVYAGTRRSDAPYVSLSFRVNGKTIDNVIVEGASSENDELVQAAIAAKEAEIAGKFLLLNKRDQLVSAHDDEEGAKEAARSAVKRGTDKGISEVGIHVEHAVRLGVERRPAGVDVSTEQLIETFGFKGVNFGTWMKGKGNEAERQLHVNHVYDAFMDLAEILGVPPKAMSLDGMLGIAVGAQGGGRNAAHFVPGINEINLTRTCGAGSLAHEWAHALDHYFGRMAGLERAGEPFLTEHATQGNEVVRQELVEGKWQRVVKPRFGDELRPEVLAHFKEIVQAMTKRPISADEVAQRDAKYLTRAEKAVDGWLKAVRQDFESARGKDGQLGATVVRGGVVVPVLDAFDGLANRVRSLDLGDGWIPAGKSRVVVPVVNEMRELYKEVTGRLYSLDNTLALQSNVDALRFAREDEQGKRERRAELVKSDYLSAAQALDGGKAKPYWSTRLEMFARAFDVYVSERLEQRAAMNSYLSHAGRKDGTTPVGEERTAVVQAFDGLVRELRTRETERGVALFSRDAAFTADSYDARVFAEAVDRVAASGIAPRTDLTIGETPAVLRALGAKALPMQMPSSVIHKASRPDIRDHNVPVSVLKDLPALLANPVMVFDSQTKPGALVAFVDAKDQSGRDIAVAIHLSASGSGFHQINRIASIYGRGGAKEISRWMEGSLRYYSKEKAPQWLHAVGLQLPEANTIERLNPRVITETDVVKQLFSTDNRVTLGRGMDPRDVVDIVHRFGERWGRMPDVTVVASPDELPFPAPGNADGAFWKGSVWLVADNLRSVGQVQKVLAHECVLHYGIQEMLGATAYDELCYQIQGLKARGDETVVGLATEVRQRYGLLSPREEAGEIIARAGERCLDPEGNLRIEYGWMKSVYAGVTSWLRKAGFEVPFSNVELQGMMHDAGKWIEKGRDQEVPAFGEAAAFSVGGESVVESANFKRWFGDSKVVDGEGRPLVVYHGTTSDFSAFNVNRRGAFFARSPEIASSYTFDDPGANVIPAYLSIKNPYIGHVGHKKPEIGSVISAAKRLGHDGAIVTYEDFPDESAYVVFQPSQIKSAIGNNREFDPQNPNILFSLAEEREPMERANPFADVTQATSGQHIGPVVEVRNGFVLQDVGRGKQVVHDLKAVGGQRVAPGEMMRVDYGRDGAGRIMVVEGVQKGMDSRWGGNTR